MSASRVVTVEHVSKRYRVYRHPIDRLREWALRRPLHHERVALDDVSFELDRGEILGIIGRNGAGKSTLLKIITGVALPDAGRARVDGPITGLLELGTGFNLELSGADNIGFNGALLGLSAQQIARKRDDMIAFSGLRDVIDDPLKTYSTGMIMRLAFSIAINADPACFIIDEALSVGDVFFQQKCIQKIREYRGRGGAVVFVSHDLNAVRFLCNRVLLLESGRTICLGTPDDAVNRYNQVIAPGDSMPAPPLPGGAPGAGAGGYGSLEVQIVAVNVSGHRSQGAVIASGELADVAIVIKRNKKVDDVTVGFAIKNRFGQEMFGTNTFHLAKRIELENVDSRRIVFQMALNLAPGAYTVTAAVHSADTHLDLCYHWCDNAAAFEIAGAIGPEFTGVCRLEPSILVD